MQKYFWKVGGQIWFCRFRFSVMQHHIVWYIGTNLLEELSASISRVRVLPWSGYPFSILCYIPENSHLSHCHANFTSFMLDLWHCSQNKMWITITYRLSFECGWVSVNQTMWHWTIILKYHCNEVFKSYKIRIYISNWQRFYFKSFLILWIQWNFDFKPCGCTFSPNFYFTCFVSFICPWEQC
jgi:hypothetical protein